MVHAACAAAEKPLGAKISPPIFKRPAALGCMSSPASLRQTRLTESVLYFSLVTNSRILARLVILAAKQIASLQRNNHVIGSGTVLNTSYRPAP